MKLISHLIFTVLIAVTLVLTPSFANAQLLDSEDYTDVNTGEAPVDEIQDTGDGGIDPGFTGTFSDEDPDSEAYKEKELFGDDEAEGGYDDSENPDDEFNNEEQDNTADKPRGRSNRPGNNSDDASLTGDEEEEEDLDATHLLRLKFDSQLLVSNTVTEETYLEINYSIEMEKEIQVKKSRYRTKGKTTITNEVIGDLFSNELVGCKLRIEMDDVKADIMTRYKVTEETEEEEGSNELALQIKLKKASMMESWFSDCTAMGGELFNTVGEKENYLYTILEAATPELVGFKIEDYIPTEEGVVELEAEPFIIEYPDSNEIYTLQGSGQVTVEPLDGYVPDEEE